MPDLPANLFLLRPENRAFLQGTRRSIVTADGPPVTGILFGLLFLAGGVAAMLFSAQKWATWQWLRRDSVTVQATVLELRQEPTEDGPINWVRYHLEAETPQGKRSFERLGQASEANYARLKVGAPVAVIHSQGDPAFSRIINERSGEMEWGGMAVGLGVALLGGFFWWRVRKVGQLARRGQVVVGEIFSSEGSKDGDGDWTVALRYRFAVPSGEVLKGKGLATRKDMEGMSPPGEGTPVAILYLNGRNHQVL